MDIGIFGGTFDPIHFGHLIVAEEVRVKMGFAKIFFIPAGQPWLKSDRYVSPAKHRLKMLSLAIDEDPNFELSTIEIDREGPSYSVDTVSTLKRHLGDEARLFFLMGSDALAELPKWKEPARLIELCQLVIFNRPGAALPSIESLELDISGISRRVIFVEVPQIDISATQIRNSIAQGASIRRFVPRNVEKYILEQNLYIE